MKIPDRPIGRTKGLLLATAAAIAILGTAAHAAEPAASPAPTAESLKEQAAEYRASAERHEKMAAMHRAGAGSSKMTHDSVVRHCDAIAKNLRAAAEESDALAEEYLKNPGK